MTTANSEKTSGLSNDGCICFAVASAHSAVSTTQCFENKIDDLDTCFSVSEKQQSSSADNHPRLFDKSDNSTNEDVEARVNPEGLAVTCVQVGKSMPDRCKHLHSSEEVQFSMDSDMAEACINGAIQIRKDSMDEVHNNAADRTSKKKVRNYYRKQSDLIHNFEKDEKAVGHGRTHSDTDDVDVELTAAIAGEHAPSVGETDSPKHSSASSIRRTETLLAQITLLVNLFLFAIKLVAGILSGSLSIFSSVVDSAVDITSGIVIWLTARAIRHSDPYRFPTGRTRLEPIALIIISVVMGVASIQAVLDRIYKAVADRVARSSPFRQALFHFLYERKRAKIEEGYDNPFLNRWVFSHIRALLGGRVRMILSGGAPVNPETQRFMNICFCCPVGQGYGLTETCGCGTICDAEDLLTGRVGPPLPCNDILLRDWPEGNYRSSNQPHPQGEILLCGANVVQGYLKNAQKTKEEFIQMEDGRIWFCTGDIGEFHSDGSLKIIDRKKDLIKLSHGEYLSLANIEMTLLTNSLIDNVCVYGNSQQSYVIALIVPNKKNLIELAQKIGVKSADFNDLCSNTKVVAEVLQTIQQHGLKNKLQKFSIPSKIHLCTEIWTAEMGLLTEALKLKRKPIENMYKSVIEGLYAN